MVTLTILPTVQFQTPWVRTLATAARAAKRGLWGMGSPANGKFPGAINHK